MRHSDTLHDKLWSGRFDGPSNPLMEEFSHSIAWDCRLFEADIQVNRAWAKALAGIGVFSADEVVRVIQALDQIREDVASGKLEFSPLDEDIHTATERWLTERIGEPGGRIHTGRSRNDQVVTDFKIYIREKLFRLDQILIECIHHLADSAENNLTVILPGYTHVRQAQPIRWAHYLLSLAFQLQRDRDRIADWVRHHNTCPLGSGALAGAAFPIDRETLASDLGFDAPMPNSIDATSDRDFVTECLFICSQIMLHLSRPAEDFIMWSSESCRFIRIADAYSTGSSMMPQKKNPDSMELIRGKTARVAGNLMTLICLMKGIPHAYARDLQEDKLPVFDSLEQTALSVKLMAEVIAGLSIDPGAMRNALDDGLYATDLADYLVRKGLPFRQAHAVVGRLVAMTEKDGSNLQSLDLEDYRQESPLFESDLFTLFNPESSVDKRCAIGGTGLESVKTQIHQIRKLIQ
ncbi:MAG: argininosuccinate lyase [Candidatus Delongbacteria bacterium]|nr:argininosuccinate lyase [Candidatus Delongbacteria bacterium]